MGSSVATPRDLAATLRGRRRDLGLSQSEVARRAGVSRQWLSEVETGKATAEVGRILQVLDTLGLEIRVQPRGTPVRSGAPGLIDLDELLTRLASS